ncbi:MAG TPA: hypothetical protein VMG81_03100 [Thermoplasmata archaeon]|nr:hypothetical protein [Thermoplasmata archaeon]
MAVAAPSPTPMVGARIPRAGALDDQGVVRRENVHALRWRLHGAGKVVGAVDVGVARLDGTVSIGGAVSADSLTARGWLEVHATVDVHDLLRTDGTFRAAGAVHAGEAVVRGTTRLSAPLSVDGTLDARGTLEVPSLRATKLLVHGAVALPGTAEAPSIVLELPRDSRIGGLRGRSVSVRGKVPNVVEKVLQHTRHVAVDRIEADVVRLEAVDVEFVRSPALVLGRDCHVTTVEGTVARCHPSSAVGPRSQSPPPYGLRR